ARRRKLTDIVRQGLHRKGRKRNHQSRRTLCERVRNVRRARRRHARPPAASRFRKAAHHRLAPCCKATAKPPSGEVAVWNFPRARHYARGPVGIGQKLNDTPALTVGVAAIVIAGAMFVAFRSGCADERTKAIASSAKQFFPTDDGPTPALFVDDASKVPPF